MREWTFSLPGREPRPQQAEAIELIIEAFESDVQFAICEMGTGVGKSAVATSVAHALKPPTIKEINPGTWYLTTQKILQEQYENDFHDMVSIKSASNFDCRRLAMTCGDARRLYSRSAGARKNGCGDDCYYQELRDRFLKSRDSVTNYPYFMSMARYTTKIAPRRLLVLDEAHTIEDQLSEFAGCELSESRAKKWFGIDLPLFKSDKAFATWLTETYLPATKIIYAKTKDRVREHIEAGNPITPQFAKIARSVSDMDMHICRCNRFVEDDAQEDWVIEHSSTRRGRNVRLRPINVSRFAYSDLFRFGQNVLIMSATILDTDVFMKTLGIEDAYTYSVPSPFVPENRKVYVQPIGKMSRANLDATLPHMVEAIKAIMQHHKNEKGIIHCHTYELAKKIRDALPKRYAKRLMEHGPDDRDDVLQAHINSTDPTVLISPSMTEGVDLRDDRSRFQIVCKVPYPYLGDPLIKKRIDRNKKWYPHRTAVTLIQSLGRSVRSASDYAATYILDQDFLWFFRQNKQLFPRYIVDAFEMP